jgi:hypothetical protein
MLIDVNDKSDGSLVFKWIGDTIALQCKEEEKRNKAKQKELEKQNKK